MNFARDFPGTVRSLRARMNQKNEWRLKQVEKIENTKELLKHQPNSANPSISPRARTDRSLEKPPIFMTQSETPNPEGEKAKSSISPAAKKKAVSSEKRLTLWKEGGKGLQAVLRGKRADLSARNPTASKTLDSERIKSINQSNVKTLKQKLNLGEESPFFDSHGCPVVSEFTERFLKKIQPRRRTSRYTQVSLDRSDFSSPRMTDSELVEYYMKKKNIHKRAHIFFQTEVATAKGGNL